MTISLTLICLFLSALGSPIFAQETPFPPKGGDILKELTPAQQSTIQNGGQVMTTTSVPGRPWPSIVVYKIISALPEQVIAVFFDYEAAYTYVPHVTESKISKKIDPHTHEVDYSLKIPLLPMERYTVRNSLRMHPEGTYEINWQLLRATSTLASEGNFRVQPYGENQSLICYSNLVVPGSKLAIALRSIAMDQVQKNVQALINQVAKQKSQNPEALGQQITVLRTALE